MRDSSGHRQPPDYHGFAMVKKLPVRLALPFPESRQWMVHGAGHFDLLSRADVYAQVKRWLLRP